MSVNLYFSEKGYGTPLVLLHGNGEDGGFFKNQIDFFAAKYRVITPDTRGHGKSPRGTEPFTFDTFADDLKNLLCSLGIEKAHILGFSDGGNIAAVFALKYPEYVESLILNSANLSPAGLKKSFLIKARADYLKYCLLSHLKKKVQKRRELLHLMVKQPDIKPEQLKSIKCPTLVIAGTRDLIKENHTRLIADSIPGARLVFIEGGHDIAQTASVEFNKTVERFLEKSF